MEAGFSISIIPEEAKGDPESIPHAVGIVQDDEMKKQQSC